MTCLPTFHIWKFLMKHMTLPNGGLRANIASQLQKGAEYVSFTTDAWGSDVNSDGFTAHWVDNDIHRQSAVLHAQELSERHTGKYFAMKIMKMLEEWNIALSQVHVAIRDNGSNMVKAMSEAYLPSFGMFCSLPATGMVYSVNME